MLWFFALVSNNTEMALFWVIINSSNRALCALKIWCCCKLFRFVSGGLCGKWVIKINLSRHIQIKQDVLDLAIKHRYKYREQWPSTVCLMLSEKVDLKYRGSMDRNSWKCWVLRVDILWNWYCFECAQRFLIRYKKNFLLSVWITVSFLASAVLLDKTAEIE